ncbi:MAG: response regulator [Magnetococcales bacterium]|nr:PAS domain-containing protein [Magnetococcales bacterium]NGZ26720.1 response regulator [Magnetococcales bacterium]
MDALKNLITAIPANSGMAFLVIQHLDPQRKSLMMDIAGHWTTLPVVVIQNNEKLLPEHIYLTPPGHLVTFSPTGVQLKLLDPSRRNYFPIDMTFLSLAEWLGPRGIGVVLSGTGRDGALGLKAIREKGGIGVVQELATAAFDFMPRMALETAGADLLLPPEQIPQALIQLLAHGHDRGVEMPNQTLPVIPPNSETLLETILDLVASRKGSGLRGYKRSTLKRRVERRMKLKDIATMADYVLLLQQETTELDLLIQDILIGVTAFFRDEKAYAILEQQVIPRLFVDKEPSQAVRVWVAGCATGEETYSIAMLLHGYRTDAALTNPIQIFATDLDDAALDEARTGCYRESVAGEVGPQRLEKFFTRKDGLFIINREVRESVVFASHNLLSDPPFSRMDLLVCRNVFIYLEQDAQAKLISIFRFVLNKGGFLFLGSSESLGQQAKHFEVVSKTWRIYCHQGKAPKRKDIPLLTGNPLQRLFAMSAIPMAPTVSMDRLYQSILENNGPALVLVTLEGELLYVTGNTQELLMVAHGEPHHDILSMVKPVLRNLLKMAMERSIHYNQVVSVRSHPDETGQAVRMTVKPISSQQGSRLLLLTLIQEPGEIATLPAMTGEAFLIQQLELELYATRSDLQRTIEQLRASNEELTAFNEEITAMNEEIQSANEELESSKEELQSLNEELSIANAALDAKVVELEQTNDDLSNLFSSTDTAILFLDQQLRIKRFTPAATRLIHLIASDIGRPMTDMAHNLISVDLLADARQVLMTHTVMEQEVRDQMGRWYLMRTLPYRTASHQVDGLVITFTEVTTMKEVEARDRATMIFLQDQAKLLNRAHLLVCDINHRILLWNVGVEEIYGWLNDEAIGKVFHELLKTEFPQPLSEIMEILLSAGQWQGDLIHHTRDGKTVTVFSHWRLSSEVESSFQAVVQVNNDTSEHRKMENQLRLAKEVAEAANQAKSDFLANVSHEIRTPMNAILGMTNLLWESPLQPDQRHYIQVCRSAGENLISVINDILDISKIEAGRLELENIPFLLMEEVKVVCAIMTVHAASKGLTFIHQFGSGIPVCLQGDPVRLRQIIFNLLSNAIKFTSHGEVRLFVESIPIPMMDQEEKVMITFRVEDTGIGIAFDRLDSIFDVFMQADTSITRRFGGTGLGLAIAKRLVRKMGGTIQVESQPGKGSVFSFAIPFMVGEAASLPTVCPSQSLPDEGGETADSLEHPCRILLVEDSEDNQTLFQFYLADTPHHLATVNNGVEAVEKVKEESFDLVLMDIQMPYMDGNAATKVIRQWEQETGRTPLTIIALSAHASVEKRNESLAAGCNDYLTKPIKKQDFLGAIRQVGKTVREKSQTSASVSPHSSECSGADSQEG